MATSASAMPTPAAPTVSAATAQAGAPSGPAASAASPSPTLRAARPIAEMIAFFLALPTRAWSSSALAPPTPSPAAVAATIGWVDQSGSLPASRHSRVASMSRRIWPQSPPSCSSISCSPRRPKRAASTRRSIGCVANTCSRRARSVSSSASASSRSSSSSQGVYMSAMGSLVRSSTSICSSSSASCPVASRIAVISSSETPPSTPSPRDSWACLRRTSPSLTFRANRAASCIATSKAVRNSWSSSSSMPSPCTAVQASKGSAPSSSRGPACLWERSWPRGPGASRRKPSDVTKPATGPTLVMSAMPVPGMTSVERWVNLPSTSSA